MVFCVAGAWLMCYISVSVMGARMGGVVYELSIISTYETLLPFAFYIYKMNVSAVPCVDVSVSWYRCMVEHFHLCARIIGIAALNRCHGILAAHYALKKYFNANGTHEAPNDFLLCGSLCNTWDTVALAWQLYDTARYADMKRGRWVWGKHPIPNS